MPWACAVPESEGMALWHCCSVSPELVWAIHTHLGMEGTSFKVETDLPSHVPQTLFEPTKPAEYVFDSLQVPIVDQSALEKSAVPSQTMFWFA